MTKLAAKGSVLLRAWRLVHSFAGSWIYGLAMTTIASGLIPVVNVFLTRELVNALANIEGNDGFAVSRLITLISILIGVILISELIDVVSDWIRMGYNELIADEIQTQIHQVSIKADYKFFEIPQFQNQLYLATSGIDDEFTSSVDNLFTLFRSSITLIAMIVVIAGFSLWLPVAIVLASVPTLILVVSQSRKDHQLRKDLVPEERRASYYDWLIQASEAAAEIRTYGLGPLFLNRFRNIRLKIRGKQLGLEKQQMLHRLGANVFGLSIMGGAMVFVITRAISGQASIGDVAMFYRTMKYSQEVGIEFVKGVGALHKNTVYLTDFFRFLDTEHQSQPSRESIDSTEQAQGGIEFRKVDFSYPANNQLVLKQLDLTIPAGKFTAILGKNGSGKSTILKLIACLYRDYEGSILIDGKNLRTFSIDDIGQQVSILYQDPMEYHLTAKENITIGSEETNSDREKFSEAVEASALDDIIGQLPEKENTLLGKWLHDGQELSGGEWHRMAMARSLFRRKGIVIMDEPTSSLDPWAEIQWTKRMKHYLQNQTLIVITHRVSVARFADHICVMDDGRVVEEGTHDMLMKLQGSYSKVCS